MQSVWVFREHRGSLESSMKTCINLSSFLSVINYVCRKCVYPTKKEDINISFYSNGDNRINWYPVYIVYTNKEVIGFCTHKFVPYYEKVEYYEI